MRLFDGTALLIHRAMAQHAPFEECPDCPVVMCRHCGDIGKPGSDHTCPCPKSDDCTEHPKRKDTP